MKILSFLALTLALSVNAYAVQIRQIADGQYNGEFNRVNLNDMQSAFNNIYSKGSGGGAPLGSVIVWTHATNPEDWENWMDCKESLTAEEQAKLAASGLCKELHICSVPNLTGRFLRQQGGNGGTVGTVQEDAVMDATLNFEGADDRRPSGSMAAKVWAGGNASGGPGQEWHVNASLLAAYGAAHIDNEIRPKSYTVRYLIRINE